jgi:DNA-nicking Smr family endonuclease
VNEPPLRGKILGITSAKPQHGGSGAFYLLIRRDRDETKRGPRP